MEVDTEERDNDNDDALGDNGDDGCDGSKEHFQDNGDEGDDVCEVDDGCDDETNDPDYTTAVEPVVPKRYNLHVFSSGKNLNFSSTIENLPNY